MIFSLKGKQKHQRSRLLNSLTGLNNYSDAENSTTLNVHCETRMSKIHYFNRFKAVCMHKTVELTLKRKINVDEICAPLVSLLNENGFFTISCCEGKEYGYILLESVYIPTLTKFLEDNGLQYWGNGSIIQNIVLSMWYERPIIQFKKKYLILWNEGNKNPLLWE